MSTILDELSLEVPEDIQVEEVATWTEDTDWETLIPSRNWSPGHKRLLQGSCRRPQAELWSEGSVQQERRLEIKGNKEIVGVSRTVLCRGRSLGMKCQ